MKNNDNPTSIGAGIQSRLVRLVVTGCMAVGLICLPSSAMAQAEARTIGLELNKLEMSGADCRATVVIRNGFDRPLSQLKLDLVVFDRESIVSKRLAAALGPLAAEKTMVKSFPITGIGCENIDHILVNEVMDCTDPEGPVPNCLDLLVLSSRAPAELRQ
ncbi:hypothetical protein [Pleomorphomonas sp. JP5]|uniref:hypothetical protein n=1 Tax=Pleomorphomonas sp. JP5 TaxID=2942998 RepID=UPI002043884A|nr:hypothetical protein [Pleomorphomonas sp. JP5]MCM5559188.1 hypothetical protein [Pleomorphomonas sp. JP5]